MIDELIAIREADGTFTRTDAGIRPLYSLTKTYIAASVIALGIDIERSVDHWIDQHWLPRAKDINVLQLLNHTSGLSDYGALPAYRQAIERGEAAWSDETFARHTLEQPLLFEPGTGWAYSNPGYWLLCQIIERETGRSFASVLNSLVLQPLDLHQTRLVEGTFADDLPRYPSNWVWHGLLVGSPADSATFMASELVTPLHDHLTRVPVDQPPWRDPHYGLGLMIEPGERFGHNGGGPGYSASCFHFTGDGRTICVLLRDDSEDDAAMKRLLALGGDR